MCNIIYIEHIPKTLNKRSNGKSSNFCAFKFTLVAIVLSCFEFDVSLISASHFNGITTRLEMKRRSLGGDVVIRLFPNEFMVDLSMTNKIQKESLLYKMKIENTFIH